MNKNRIPVIIIIIIIAIVEVFALSYEIMLELIFKESHLEKLAFKIDKK